MDTVNATDGQFTPLGWTEFFGVAAILVFTFLIFSFGRVALGGAALPGGLGLTSLFLPLGPLLFALAGRSAMAQVVEKGARRSRSGEAVHYSPVSPFGALSSPMAVYFIFVLGILRLTPNPAPDTLSGLGGLPPVVLVV